MKADTPSTPSTPSPRPRSAARQLLDVLLDHLDTYPGPEAPFAFRSMAKSVWEVIHAQKVCLGGSIHLHHGQDVWSGFLDLPAVTPISPLRDLTIRLGELTIALLEELREASSVDEYTSLRFSQYIDRVQEELEGLRTGDAA